MEEGRVSHSRRILSCLESRLLGESHGSAPGASGTGRVNVQMIGEAKGNSVVPASITIQVGDSSRGRVSGAHNVVFWQRQHPGWDAGRMKSRWRDKGPAHRSPCSRRPTPPTPYSAPDHVGSVDEDRAAGGLSQRADPVERGGGFLVLHEWVRDARVGWLATRPHHKTPRDRDGAFACRDRDEQSSAGDAVDALKR